ncbi:MAG: HlyD family secretion protein [Alphaproteobacteria bacterium]|nr:HlyD family secretion protein [Alphaproteobacteria bacterium]
MTQPSTATKTLVTSAVVLLAVVMVAWKFWDYYRNPWTRNGRVMAQVIQITPRVTGWLVDLPVVDNQFVKKGDLLFRIDPRTFESTLHGMEGLLAETEDEIEALAAQVEATAKTILQYEAAVQRAQQKVKGKAARLEDYRAQFKRYTELVKTGAASEERLDRARADVVDAESVLDAALAELLAAQALKLQADADLARDKANLGAEGPLNARRRTAKARVHSAELKLEFTEVRAPVDGYVTNLNLRLGDHAVENNAILALVDVNSFWVYGYFKEWYLEDMRIGDRANVVLLGYPDTPLTGRVTGRGWGIFRKDGATAQQLLPKISATFQWVRQARRIPVRIELDPLPKGVELVVGATATVQVRTGTAETRSQKFSAAAPQTPR